MVDELLMATLEDVEQAIPLIVTPGRPSALRIAPPAQEVRYRHLDLTHNRGHLRGRVGDEEVDVHLQRLPVDRAGNRLNRVGGPIRAPREGCDDLGARDAQVGDRQSTRGLRDADRGIDLVAGIQLIDEVNPEGLRLRGLFCE